MATHCQGTSEVTMGETGEAKKGVMIIKADIPLTMDSIALIKGQVQGVADELGLSILFAEKGLDLTIWRDMEPLLGAIGELIFLMQKTIEQNSQILLAIAAEDNDDDDEPKSTYLDGSHL